jgi:Fe-S-cluster-containing dehydrogenase component/CRP-like cAMP-binding protein
MSTSQDGSELTLSVARPRRWDEPFDPLMTDGKVDEVLELPEFKAIDQSKFPAHLSLASLLRNDSRIVNVHPGEIILRKGDYGNSAFLVIEGLVLVVQRPDLPPHLLGRLEEESNRGWFSAMAQLWRNHRIPEVRRKNSAPGAETDFAMADEEESTGSRRRGVILPEADVATLSSYTSVALGAHSLFGEVAAITRAPRTASIVATTASTLLEIRWQGLRDIAKFAPAWRQRLEGRYRSNAAQGALSSSPVFAGLGNDALKKIADSILFESYGTLDWDAPRRRAPDDEPIAEEGGYADGLLVITSGFARVSKLVGHGRKTLTVLGAGGFFGLDELYDSWKMGEVQTLACTLSALGYVGAIRIPTPLLEDFVFPQMRPPEHRLVSLAKRPVSRDGLLEFAVSERLINGTQSMLINLDRCVHCDDCVVACANAHDGNPRFKREGKIFDHWMIAEACMHCIDAVCLVGCPTGAIQRSEAGRVVINDATCIGCGTCARACPYDAIRMVNINDESGRTIRDPAHHAPIQKATKCDLCSTQLGGPACVRACPHGALRRIDFKEEVFR